MGTAIIAGVDTPPVFEFAKHVLDFMPLAVKLLVEFCGQQPTLARRDTRCDAFGFQRRPIFIAVIALVADHAGGMHWNGWICKLCTDLVNRLPFGQAQDYRPAVTIAHCVQLRVQPAFGASNIPGNISGKRPFFKRLAAVRWAFKWVASIIRQSSASLVAARAANILLKTPGRLQRTKRL